MTDIEIQHRILVGSLCKPGADIKRSLTKEDCHLLHMAFALLIEAGELCDPIKKALIYRKPMDMENIIEELGDVEFYLQAIRQHFGLNRDDILAANRDKLTKRYPGGKFTKGHAIKRLDKQ